VEKGSGSVRRLLLAAVVFFAPASAAHAAPVRMVVRDVLPQPTRALAAASSPSFNLVGLHWQGEGTPWFRTRSLAGRWSRWEPADDDWGRVGVWRRSNAVWTGAADAIQVRTKGRVTRVREYLLWSPPVRVPERRLQLAGSPAIISRAGWQADESIRRVAPKYAPSLQFALVHHTATTNAYSCVQSASIVRGIEVYHVKGNGWNDIGYNFLVDACGQIFEGRYGGIERNVVGAHSQGFNTGSVGAALIGNFQTAAPSQAQQDALVKLLAWRLDVAHVDPLSLVTYSSGGNSKFGAGRPVSLRAVSGHRDTYLTDCPGNGAYRLLPAIASRVAQTGLPKLYAPVVSGAVGGPVRFAARLSSFLPWTVTVTDAAGAVVATWSDIGTSVDWTWDSRLAVPGAAYFWTISSAANVRAATGTLGGKVAGTALTLTNLQVSPPALDGSVFATATVTYTLSAAATVTADLVDASGVVVATLFSQSLPAGAQSFLFAPPAGVADGNYTIRVTARDALGRQVQATVPVAVSHTLLAFSAGAKIVSPNGDGRRDVVTFRFLLAQPADATLELATPEASFPLLLAQLGTGRQTFAFTGTAADGSPVPDGVYEVRLTAGAVTQSLPLTIDNLPPTVSLVSVAPLQLRVAEHVTVIATINGRVVRASLQPGIVRLAKREVVRTLRVVVRDAAGNESQPVTYRAK
jgi:flagellar hook assembly protein FlgD